VRSKGTVITESKGGKWAGRFIWAAIVQGAILTIITVLIVEPWSFLNINSYYSPSKVIAGGGGGTWLFTGYILYLVVGVIAVAVTALFYFYFEGVLGRVYHGMTNGLAWAHYILMNVGVAGSMLLMMYGGYIAGYDMSIGYSAEQIHVTDLGNLTDPIGALVLIAAIGVLLGGLGFVLRGRMK
jgi:hypothetical protein